VAYEWECDYVDEPLASCLIHSESAMVKLHRFGPGEMTRTLKKIETRYPESVAKYGSSIAHMRREIDYKQGNSYRRDGKNSEARATFSKHLGSAKFLVSYVATALPYSWEERLYRLIRQ